MVSRVSQIEECDFKKWLAFPCIPSNVTLVNIVRGFQINIKQVTKGSSCIRYWILAIHMALSILLLTIQKNSVVGTQFFSQKILCLPGPLFLSTSLCSTSWNNSYLFKGLIIHSKYFLSSSFSTPYYWLYEQSRKYSICVYIPIFLAFLVFL